MITTGNQRSINAIETAKAYFFHRAIFKLESKSTNKNNAKKRHSSAQRP